MSPCPSFAPLPARFSPGTFLANLRWLLRLTHSCLWNAVAPTSDSYIAIIALKFLDLSNYWNREGSQTHEKVTYAGSAQFVCPSFIFDDIEDFLDYFPRRYLSVTDLWLNSYVTDRHGGSLRSSGLPEHSSLDRGTTKKSMSRAFSTAAGMRALKTEFLQYIVTHPHHKNAYLLDFFEQRLKAE